jgi:hypothetical protein
MGAQSEYVELHGRQDAFSTPDVAADGRHCAAAANIGLDQGVRAPHYSHRAAYHYAVATSTHEGLPTLKASSAGAGTPSRIGSAATASERWFATYM